MPRLQGWITRWGTWSEAPWSNTRCLEFQVCTLTTAKIHSPYLQNHGWVEHRSLQLLWNVKSLLKKVSILAEGDGVLVKVYETAYAVILAKCLGEWKEKSEWQARGKCEGSEKKGEKGEWQDRVMNKYKRQEKNCTKCEYTCITMVQKFVEISVLYGTSWSEDIALTAQNKRWTK